MGLTRRGEGTDPLRHPAATLAIIGAGCSGTLVAIHLLRRFADPGTRILLFERRGVFGPGLAYGKAHSDHRLNVPAGGMSAFPDQPDDFLDWARRCVPSATRSCFLPRRLYGAYLGALLEEAERQGLGRGVVLERCSQAATEFRRVAGGRLGVETASGSVEPCDAIVLALGNLPPAGAAGRWPLLARSDRFIADPWATGALAIRSDEPVLLLGTGLTMIDVAVALDAAGHSAPISGVSRRGLVAQPHRSDLDPRRPRRRPRNIESWPTSALGLLRSLRREIECASAEGYDWRDVMASLRHDTPRLWESLSVREQRRFLEHLRPWWDAHRHRSAPEPAATVAAMRSEGRLEVLAGRVVGHEEVDGVMRLALRLRDGSSRAVAAARVIDCTGPCCDVTKAADPLLSSLLDQGLGRPDPLRLGLDTDWDGALIDRAGDVQPRLFTLGPLRKGTLWECTAVPEIRVQAAQLAERIAPLAAKY